MYQADRGTYQKKETVGQMFFNSCLGRLIIVFGILVAILFVAAISCPTAEEMNKEMLDNVRQCLAANDGIRGDRIDDTVNNIGYIFTDADSLAAHELMEEFHKYNRMETYEHTFYTTTRLVHYRAPEGIRIGIGIFGMIIPTLVFDDMVLQEEPARKSYGGRIIKEETVEENADLYQYDTTLDNYDDDNKHHNKSRYKYHDDNEDARYGEVPIEE